VEQDRFDAVIAFYPSRDLEANRAFYEGMLGLPLARDQQSCQIFAVTGGGYLGFCHHDRLPDDGEEQHLGLILTLVTDEVDAVHARLDTLGVATDGVPRWNERYGIYHFFTRDPDGYRVEVQRFRDPLP
jgi:catechol 2,3-dioxygenase-like lactoylglutathione lyase family enzyme